ncbi:MAG: PIG-L family deacetylase [Dehalogenimonas sp.]|uniref:PIG-L family deacetylase n=1 Tax=Candidatus Dehalogenimonas loeffleri TaxID=3127115 RepID=A0ABZ2J192_9CHLR|nr:PIG-L family deacetylase [Dehalogenimonas sp.]
MTTTPKRLLFVGAHPDDESFGPGATLALYVQNGVSVYYVCATGGESGTVEAKYLNGFPSIRDLRQSELECAAKALGLAKVFYLGYRDSGMPGSPDNQNPESLFRAPLADVTARIVKIIREVKPQVVLTHDPRGDYGHPDHVAVHQAATAAFHAAGDAGQFPHCGQSFSPQKLYYNVMPHRLLKLIIRFLPLFGQDPKRFGRNHDIDLTTIVNQTLPATTVIKLDRRSLRIRHAASICHQSQMQGGSLRRTVSNLLERFSGANDVFSLAFPQQSGGKTENDLFQDLPPRV